MKTTAIKVEGQIISPEIFDNLDSGEIKGQSSNDYGFDAKVKVKEEIQRAWANAKDQWKIFKRYTEPLTEEVSGTTETRRYWIIPLLSFLGYNVTVSRAEIVNENSYAISHRDMNIDGFPIHIVSFNDSLDRKRESSGPRLSPHALVQEYLNLTEHLYGFVTNGNKLRLLRDSGKLVRLTFVEFDLQKMMEEDLYAEFSIMYRLLHISRMPQKMSEGDISLIEQYHQDSLEAGARIREKLSGAVEESIKVLGNGFLSNSKNQQLIELIKSGQMSANGFYQHLLRLVYRILFLMVLEERDIVYPNDDGNGNTKYYKDLYYEYYSLQRLRRLSEKIFFFNEKLFDLWISLRNTFKIFGSEKLAEKIKLYPLDGDLFDFGSLGVLSNSDIDNRTLLQCIKNLSQFDDKDTGSIIRVNYSALNVEEFGSVYEGLLEKAPAINFDGQHYSFSFVEGTERSSSGSHYTPEELVQPLIKHSLDYVIEDKLKNALSFRTKRSGDPESTSSKVDSRFRGNDSEEREAKEKALLSIKVCDVACGSGHILLSAARRIAQELTKVRTGEDQPSPEPYRQAIRDVINHCIYGVDKNPLAVELCKVALWLEAHNPGMPLNFLDHKIKCGDSIVGLARIEELQNGIATEAFKTLPGDDKIVAALFRKQNKTDRENRTQLKLTDTEEIINNLNTISVKFKNFNLLPDTTVDEVKKKQQEYNLLKGSDWIKLKELADIQTAQFFIDKTNGNKEFLTTDAEYFRIFAGQKKEVNTRKISQAMAVAAEKKFFHWFLEFPEVFSVGKHPDPDSSGEGSTSGFDCILGNPPYLGGVKISGEFGNQLLNFITNYFAPAGKQADLVTYFLKRISNLSCDRGFFSLLTTDKISQGDSRELGLLVLMERRIQIIFAIKSTNWPGAAAVKVAILSLTKRKDITNKFLNAKKVHNINSHLSEEVDLGEPKVLYANLDTCFKGVVLKGIGFVIDNNIKDKLINNNRRNADIIYPFLVGADLNENSFQLHSRYIINFGKRDLEECKRNYPEALDIIEKTVKPYRETITTDNLAKNNWWQLARSANSLYENIGEDMAVFARSLASKHNSIVRLNSKQVFDQALVVFSRSNFDFFTFLISNIHYEWANKYSSDLGSTYRYNIERSFETFPFPQNLTKETESVLEKIGEEYHEFRRQLMLGMQLGLTKTYNLFHDPECNSNNIAKTKEIREFKSANLQIPIEVAIQRIEKLRALHKQMDEAVLKAYGWTDINLAHAYYEVDYLPENDRVRYTISPEARKEILKRLLELNHKIHAEEVAMGLWEKKTSKKKIKAAEVREQQEKYGQGGLFGEK